MKKFLSVAAIAAVIASMAAPASASWVFAPDTSRPPGTAHSTITQNGVTIDTCNGTVTYQVNGTGGGTMLKLGFGTGCPDASLTTFPQAMTAKTATTFTVDGPLMLMFGGGSSCTFLKLQGTLNGINYTLSGNDGVGCILSTTGTMNTDFAIVAPPPGRTR